MYLCLLISNFINILRMEVVFFYSVGNLSLTLAIFKFPVSKTDVLVLFTLSLLSVLISKVKKVINEVR